jgi:hypothetical protein
MESPSCTGAFKTYRSTVPRKKPPSSSGLFHGAAGLLDHLLGHFLVHFPQGE